MRFPPLEPRRPGAGWIQGLTVFWIGVVPAFAVRSFQWHWHDAYAHLAVASAAGLAAANWLFPQWMPKRIALAALAGWALGFPLGFGTLHIPYRGWPIAMSTDEMEFVREGVRLAASNEPLTDADGLFLVPALVPAVSVATSLPTERNVPEQLPPALRFSVTQDREIAIRSWSRPEEPPLTPAPFPRPTNRWFLLYGTGFLPTLLVLVASLGINGVFAFAARRRPGGSQ
jgi:hypothetical protein